MTTPSSDRSSDSANRSPKVPKPPLWNRLPRYVKGTHIRSSTAILVVLFVVLMFWYLDLRTQFVPEEERRTGQTMVQTTTEAPVAPTTSTPESEPSIPSSAIPSSGADRSGSASTSASPSPQSGASTATTTSGESSGDATTSPDGAGTTTPTTGGAETTPAPGSGGAPTTSAAPS